MGFGLRVWVALNSEIVDKRICWNHRGLRNAATVPRGITFDIPAYLDPSSTFHMPSVATIVKHHIPLVELLPRRLHINAPSHEGPTKSTPLVRKSWGKSHTKMTTIYGGFPEIGVPFSGGPHNKDCSI